MSASRIVATPAAAALIDELKARHGSLMFHQSGGCCEGSAPMCLQEGEFLLGASDVKVGTVHGVPFYMNKTQFEYWQHTHLTLDAIAGHGGMFSLEQATGKHFLIHSRLFTDEELQDLEPVEQCG
ncbi:DUF779 domain-containing protein [Methylobacillus flagellatus]|uniref:UDP-glucose 4-epimerase n=1 Tax=Methylobacillus flagellatus (strain ATCC 51484 / DSM 6875 / VKM B-1610 / KT) TaxID=265072 RepID=Q1GZS6_METFK|nr:DUF779 domain-containing protein [Methylobacillus flagellatus]ABE50261.1 protein of unknown function DUF779 [Methylobacillus flagellatus KT]